MPELRELLRNPQLDARTKTAAVDAVAEDATRSSATCFGC